MVSLPAIRSGNTFLSGITGISLRAMLMALSTNARSSGLESVIRVLLSEHERRLIIRRKAKGVALFMIGVILDHAKLAIAAGSSINKIDLLPDFRMKTFCDRAVDGGFFHYFPLFVGEIKAFQVDRYLDSCNPSGIRAHNLGHIRACGGKGNTFFHSAYPHCSEHTRSQRGGQEIGGGEGFPFSMVVHRRICYD